MLRRLVGSQAETESPERCWNARSLMLVSNHSKMMGIVSLFGARITSDDDEAVTLRCWLMPLLPPSRLALGTAQ